MTGSSNINSGKTGKSTYFPALTGIRAAAAYLVFAGHTDIGQNTLPLFFANLIKMAGHCSLTVFFVLSGFVIASRYANSFESVYKDFGRYYIRRFARIFPLFFILTVIVLLLKRDFSGWHWFLNLTFLKGFFEKEKFTGISQAWSLTVEECFYLLAPFLFGAFRKNAPLTILLVFLTGLGLVAIGNYWPETTFMSSVKYMVEYSFFGRCFEFYCGYKLAQIVSSKSENYKPLKFNIKLTYLGLFLMFGILLLIVFFLGKYFDLFNTTNLEISIMLDNYVLPLAICVFFYGLLLERTFLSRLFSAKFVQFLGRNSFAFSLLHGGIIYEVVFFHISQHKIIIFLCMNVLATLAYHLIEEPVNQYIRRKTNKTKDLIAA